MTTFTRPLAVKLILTTTLLLSATACGNTWGQRAVTGGAISSTGIGGYFALAYSPA